MDILNSEENIDEYLFDKHSYDYIIEDIEYEEITFEGFDVKITKKI